MRRPCSRLLVCPLASVPVSVMVAPQNVGVVWEAGQILEVIGAAQGNPAPTMHEYTSIPFAKGFGQQTATQPSAGRRKPVIGVDPPSAIDSTHDMRRAEL